jgi:hypothetical protein
MVSLLLHWRKVTAVMMEVNVEMILADSMDGVYSNKTYGDRRSLGALCSCGQWQTSGVQPFHS